MAKKHYYAIDLESWVYPNLPEFHDMTMEERKNLDGGYIVDSTCKILRLLEKYKTKLTFFVIGELFEWYPQLIKEIRREGHEVAYHTHTHVLLKNSKVIEEQLSLSKDFIKEFSPKGFQAPIIYFPKNGYRVISKYGFSYSSSIYHPDIIARKIDDVLEVPVSTYRFWGERRNKVNFPRPMNFGGMLREIPFGSSYFTAMIGSRITSYFLRLYERMDRSAVLFIHNWQIFPPQHATYPNFKFLIQHPIYLPYLRNIRSEFEELLNTFSFGKMEEISEH